MWGLFSSLFLLVYAIMIIYIGRRGWVTIGRRISGVSRAGFVLILACFALAYPFLEMGSDIIPGLSSILASASGWYAMLTVVYFFLLLLVVDVLRLLCQRTGLISETLKNSIKTPIIIAVCISLSVGAILAYGTWRAGNPVITRYNLTIEKQAAGLKQLKMALVSDIHFGENIDIAGVRKMVEITQSFEPDVILLAGDIIEGVPSAVEAERLQAAFKKMSAPYGVYAVAGNHDRWLRNTEGVNFFREAGIQVLKEELVKINESFYIIGRDDLRNYREPGRKPIEAYVRETDPSLPIILLDHQPLELEQARNAGVDLQLAGHTHKGQVFPASLITAGIYELDWGLLQKDSYHLVVSSGYGTWGPPLRIGTRPEVVEITLNFK